LELASAVPTGCTRRWTSTRATRTSIWRGLRLKSSGDLWVDPEPASREQQVLVIDRRGIERGHDLADSGLALGSAVECDDVGEFAAYRIEL
jgi:hypothetical protein